MFVGEQAVQNTIGDKKYTVTAKGNENIRLYSHQNKVYLNDIEVPNETGIYRLKNFPNIILKIEKAKDIRSISYDSMNTRDKIELNKNKNMQTRVINGHDICGMHQKLVDLNIIVYGHLIISGMRNNIYRGKEDINLPTLIIKGDLIISGMRNTVGNIIAIHGEIVDSGMYNKII